MTRIWHPWQRWECFRAGLYGTSPPAPMSPEAALRAYAEFLSDTDRFKAALAKVLSEWTFSCEHFLSNDGINRVAWLGQASMCIDTGVPSAFRAGFKLLDEREREIANATAFQYLTIWLRGQQFKQLPLAL
jgi:hypothetical protein